MRPGYGGTLHELRLGGSLHYERGKERMKRLLPGLETWEAVGRWIARKGTPVDRGEAFDAAFSPRMPAPGNAGEIAIEGRVMQTSADCSTLQPTLPHNLDLRLPARPDS